MTFADLAAKRRSIRKFTGRKVEKEVIDQLIATTLTAPSSKSSRSTRIAVTADPKIMEIVSRMRPSGSAFVKDAPLAFFIMGEESVTDLWRENCSISAIMLQLAAEDMGLGTCWVHVNGRAHSADDPHGMMAEDFLKEQIPALAPYRILCVVVAGYHETELRGRAPVDDSDKVVWL